MSHGDLNVRDDVPFPANGPVNVEDAYEMAAQEYPAPQPPVPSYEFGRAAPPPTATPMRLSRPALAAPMRSQIVSPRDVLAMLRQLNPEKVRLAGTVFGESATSEGNLLRVLSKVDPPVLVGVLGLADDIMGALSPAAERQPSDILLNLELLGSVLVLMSRPQMHAQALQALSVLLA